MKSAELRTTSVTRSDINSSARLGPSGRQSPTRPHGDGLVGSALGRESGPWVLSCAAGTFKDPNKSHASGPSFVKGASDFQGNLIYKVSHPNVSRISIIVIADA